MLTSVRWSMLRSKRNIRNNAIPLLPWLDAKLGSGPEALKKFADFWVQRCYLALRKDDLEYTEKSSPSWSVCQRSRTFARRMLINASSGTPQS